MGTTTKDQRRIRGGYSQKEGTNMGRKLENKRRRTQRRIEKTRREDDGKIQTCMQAFYNNQFKRDAKLLNIMKEKEKEMENNMLRKIDGFKHIYKELFKEFEKIMKERDQQLEIDDEYRRKTWLESMDLINQNLSKLLECISEVEGTVNQVGERQDMLIRAVQLNNETSTKGKGVSPTLERQKAEIKFPRFDPGEASFDVDPPNIVPKRAYKRRKGN